jgi:hypothetical protein
MNRRRFEDNFKMDVKEIGWKGLNRIEVAQNWPSGKRL